MPVVFAVGALAVLAYVLLKSGVTSSPPGESAPPGGVAPTVQAQGGGSGALGAIGNLGGGTAKAGEAGSGFQGTTVGAGAADLHAPLITDSLGLSSEFGMGLGINVAKGAATGASIGTALNPGAGTVIGAGVGAAAGAFVTFAAWTQQIDRHSIFHNDFSPLGMPFIGSHNVVDAKGITLTIPDKNGYPVFLSLPREFLIATVCRGNARSYESMKRGVLDVWRPGDFSPLNEVLYQLAPWLTTWPLDLSKYDWAKFSSLDDNGLMDIINKMRALIATRSQYSFGDGQGGWNTDQQARMAGNNTALQYYGLIMDYVTPGDLVPQTNPTNYAVRHGRVGRGYVGAWRIVSGDVTKEAPFTFECWVPQPQEITPTAGQPIAAKLLPCVPVQISSTVFLPIFGTHMTVYRKLQESLGIAWRPDMASISLNHAQALDVWEAAYPHLFKMKQSKWYFGNLATPLGSDGGIKLTKETKDFAPKPNGNGKPSLLLPGSKTVNPKKISGNTQRMDTSSGGPTLAAQPFKATAAKIPGDV